MENKFKAEGFWFPNVCKPHYQRYIRKSQDAEIMLPYLRGRKTVIQAGGHVGLWPLYLSRIFKEVITFEICPLNYECLLLNANKINITAIHGALDRRPGKVGVVINDANSGGHWIEQGETIQAYTIDSLEQKPDAICLDVEGAELRVLLGAIETLKTCSPVLLLEMTNKIEYTGLGTKEELTGLLEFLGYSNVGARGKDQLWIRH